MDSYGPYLLTPLLAAPLLCVGCLSSSEAYYLPMMSTPTRLGREAGLPLVGLTQRRPVGRQEAA